MAESARQQVNDAAALLGLPLTLSEGRWQDGWNRAFAELSAAFAERIAAQDARIAALEGTKGKRKAA